MYEKYCLKIVTSFNVSASSVCLCKFNWVTINFLYGTSQEDRNRPLEDALKLLVRINYERILSERENMLCKRAKIGGTLGAIWDL